MCKENLFESVREILKKGYAIVENVGDEAFNCQIDLESIKEMINSIDNDDDFKNSVGTCSSRIAFMKDRKTAASGEMLNTRTNYQTENNWTQLSKSFNKTIEKFPNVDKFVVRSQYFNGKNDILLSFHFFYDLNEKESLIFVFDSYFRK